MSNPATYGSFLSHWPEAADLDQDKVEERLQDAWVMARAEFPDLVARLESGAQPSDAAALAIHRATRRSLTERDGELRDAESISQNAGPFGQTINFTTPDAVGEVFFRASEKKLLSVGRAASSESAFTIFPKTR